jgi:hypothetical protein
VHIQKYGCFGWITSATADFLELDESLSNYSKYLVEDRGLATCLSPNNEAAYA